MAEYEDTIEKLKAYFEKRDDVVMAFLFGSRAYGRARRSSDWDIGVYLTAENRNREQEIWASAEKIVETDVDLVVLNRAPAKIAWPIVRTGIPLAIKNRHAFLKFMIRVSHEANEWYDTASEYHRIFERSASLTEGDRNRLERTLQFIKEEVADFATFQSLSWKLYANDRSKKREVERWAEQLMNAVIDIAQVVLASEHKVIPETYRRMVEMLGVVTPFDFEACEALARWTELRNILAHEYLDYRWKELEIFIRTTQPLFEKLNKATQVFLAGQQNSVVERDP